MGIRGHTIVFTGKISKPRHAFQKLVEEHGGIAGNDITRSTSYLVVGEKPGSKLVRAVSLGIRTISEGEFLNLLKEEEEDETPLSFAELQILEDKLSTLTCSTCGRTYKQWNDKLNYETCGVCSFKASPRCPHCTSLPVFIEDMGIYHCMLCGTWFKAPYSIRAKRSKHHHLFVEAKRDEKGILKQCLCGSFALIPYESEEEHKIKYEQAPQWIKEWTERDTLLSQERSRKEEALRYIESLSDEDRLKLWRQLNEHVSETSTT